MLRLTPARALLGEALGTFLLVGIGTGTVASSVLFGVPGSLPGVAAVWGLGVAVAILATAPLSGAHLNPAISLALAIWRPEAFPRRRLGAYVLAQLAGAALAGGMVLILFGPALRTFEADHGLVRGGPGSERAAMIFGDYFPNPAGGGPAVVSPLEAAGWETAGTAVLAFLVFAVSGARSDRVRRLAPWIVGACITVLVILVAPVTQAGLNPARDLGPRLVAWCAGYGPVALPGPGGGFWVYLVGPAAGAVLGGFVFERGFRSRGSGKEAA